MPVCCWGPQCQAPGATGSHSCTECKKPERLVQCGRGALLLRSREQMKAGHYLIKTHGVEYTSDATRGARADALLKYIERRMW